jgi:hypothetical protein
MEMLVKKGKRFPAVALRYAAGYAHHTPAGLKISFFAWSA